ncbi:MAG: bifunctional phosphoribosylaminoimidazolecarboxamide formyltransferase/IMP cyclohydrolase [Candidatus Cloacimonetes bacterium]|nr:bifunctional phosphoribosylaminoimidazolecarboxamide formyltransferase/IMP cyclohydrolase [Candidatus Cloacimonadota bacterium]
MKKYALISVSDKSGAETLASGLAKLGYGILSSSGTASHLRDRGLEVVEVEDVTGFPEILDGRVKTLHPHIHAGILADRSNPEHLATLDRLGIQRIDLVAVNLYPFRKTLAKIGSTRQQIIENIDIGGPSLLRAAAKNHAGVIVLCDPADYGNVLRELQTGGELPLEKRIRLARKAFAHVAAYDAAIANWLQCQEHADSEPELPDQLEVSMPRAAHLRYGENPHQRAALYASGQGGLSLLHGLELSFNNQMDIDATLRALRLFEAPTVVITKHCNPCGVGCAERLQDAYKKALAADTESPFGGIVGLNRALDLETARLINQIFTEIIVAPDYENGVLEFLRKKKNRRLIRWDEEVFNPGQNPWELKQLLQGWLLQERDLVNEDPSTWRCVTRREPSAEEMQALGFAWKVAALLRSNAIALTGNDRVFGLGAGQTSRIDALQLAVMKARKFGHSLSGAVCASDGFFPFRDSIDALHDAGVRAVIQPGGSKGDPEVIAACDELGLAMVFTGCRHFRH